MVVALLAGACGKKSSEPAAGGKDPGKPAPTAPAPAAPTPAAPTPAAPTAKADKANKAKKPAPAKITKEVRAAYKKHLQAGRTLAKATKWPEALKELEAALAAIPGDDRALAELSYAYMASGDHDKARKAGRAAVRAATEPKIKAAALYNLGRVEESSAPAKAADLYRQSLALRPNATVQKRLAELAGKLSDKPEPLACSKPMAEADVCGCLLKSAGAEGGGEGEGEGEDEGMGGQPTCELEATDVAGFKLARYSLGDLGEEHVAVVGQGKAGWGVVASLAYIYNPGAFGISEDWTLGSVREEKLGDRTIVRIESSKSRQDSDMGIDEIENEDTKELLVCVRDPRGGLPTCPLDVTLEYSYLRDRAGLVEAGDLSDVSDIQTKGLPIKDETKVVVTLGADGIAKVRAERGRPAADVVGDKKLW